MVCPLRQQLFFGLSTIENHSACVGNWARRIRDKTLVPMIDKSAPRPTADEHFWSCSLSGLPR